MQLNENTRKLAIEIIVNLVNIKNLMYEHILKPAGVKKEQFARLRSLKNPEGKPLTKREIGILLLDESKNQIEEKKFIKSLIELAAKWNRFHLADNEYSARAIVQKAREELNTIEIMEANEAQLLEEEKKREILRVEELKRKVRQDRKKEIYERSKLLLLMFDEMATKEKNPQRKGYLLEELTNMLFQLYDIALLESFRRNNGGEQIDGAFKLDGWHYLVEMKWTNQLTDMSQLDSLYGKVSRSGKQTMGLFISINGWSQNVIPLMKQHPDKTIFLMDGFDLRVVLAGEIDLIEILHKKIAKFNLLAEPFVGAKELI
ncbi:hypothetical protein [Halalkalibacter nanhaiisediminis]|uniref:Restriction endonuclease n=1 Tax=Halalkalibacter nanhaiisediminis TaxID=688079 RepID=A0A562QJW3_9BACI|nr:hypothetical protein [Halalkalibacter nanhaiisediminis]TWI57057.1 hypothetical protein IQ10_01759 [Halalkalibacter nanhaiisediminis]